MDSGVQGCILSILILHDEEIPVTAEKINALLKAACVSAESYWPSLFAKLAQNRNIEDLILNAGSGGGGAVAVAAPAAGAGAGAAAAAPAAEEKKVLGEYPDLHLENKRYGCKAQMIEEVKEESDDDMGFGLSRKGVIIEAYTHNQSAVVGGSLIRDIISNAHE
ncbi:60S acidic ribosomal protein P1-3, partial [Mucuna pruriens]